MRPTAYRRNARGLRDRQAFEHVRTQAGALFAAGRSQAQIARELGSPGKSSAAGTPADRPGWRRYAAPAWFTEENRAAATPGTRRIAATAT